MADKMDKMIKKNFKIDWTQARPVLIMLLCTCIAFSGTASYIPPAVPAAETEPVAGTEETETLPVTEAEETEETETVEETEEETEEPGYESAPYRLNPAYLYEEGAEESYAMILLKELIARDSAWYSEIYDMANMAPARLASSLGRSRASVLGQYNPASKTQDADDASTWAVEHFKNVRISFYNGDGEVTSAVSNAQDILSMASVYAYYNGIESLEEFESYVNELWKHSHSYSVSMGEVYYCDGCVNPDQSADGDGLDDSELSGEDTFPAGWTIDTEMMATDEGEEKSEEDGESGSGIPSSNPPSGTTEQASVDIPDHVTADSDKSYEVYTQTQTENSVIQSLAETAESVIMEETKPKITIIREATTAAGETAKPSGTGSQNNGGRPTIVRDNETTAEASGGPDGGNGMQGASDRNEGGPDSGNGGAGESSGSPDVTGATGDSESSGVPKATGGGENAAGIPGQEADTTSAETFVEETPSDEPPPEPGAAKAAAGASGNQAGSFEADGLETVAADSGVPSPGTSDYRVYAATAAQGSETEGPEEEPSGTSDSPTADSAGERVCPGHIDLKITAKVVTLSEENNLYALDSKGSEVTEDGAWEGWTDRTTAYVRHINRQDWTEEYDLYVTVEGTRAPLSNAEIESYMNQLPENTTEARKDIIRYALQSVGKIPYYWGGKASSPNYGGNHFGTVTIPDHRGRIIRGLDCSGWINWVYWSVTGSRLPYEGTEGLKETGRQIRRSDLKPGDIIVITGNTPHVIMFMNWTANGQIQCIHETGSANNVTVGVMTANWPYYRNLLD